MKKCGFSPTNDVVWGFKVGLMKRLYGLLAQSILWERRGEGQRLNLNPDDGMIQRIFHKDVLLYPSDYFVNDHFSLIPTFYGLVRLINVSFDYIFNFFDLCSTSSVTCMETKAKSKLCTVFCGDYE